MPDTLVVRTARFAFTMGARIDPTWPARAEETRDALGASLGVLLEREDTLVPMLGTELGLDLPLEPADFEVALAPAGGASSCDDRSLGRRITLARGGADPALFFACVLRRSLGRRKDESATFRAMPPGEASGRLYACVTGYAVAAALVATAADASSRRAIEAGLGEACSARELAWLGTEWRRRVDDELTARELGARAAGALLAPPP